MRIQVLDYNDIRVNFFHELEIRILTFPFLHHMNAQGEY